MCPEDAVAMANTIESPSVQVVMLGAEVAQAHVHSGTTPKQARMMIVKEIRPDRFMGAGFNNWADDVKALLMAKQPSYGRALEWAEDQNVHHISARDVDLQRDIHEAENRDLHTYVMLHTAEQPNIIVKASRGMETAEAPVRFGVKGDAGGSHAQGVSAAQDHRYEEHPLGDRPVGRGA